MNLEIDPFELVRAEEMVLGYISMWGNDGLTPLEVEVESEAPLNNPSSGLNSRIWRLGGKLDGIVRRNSDAKVFVMERKTSSEDLKAGAMYWKRLTMNSQISTYLVLARALGYEIEGTLYDVLAKVSLRPYKATPLEKREYTQPKSKACPGCKGKKATPAPHRFAVNFWDGTSWVQCSDGRVTTEPGGRLHSKQRETDETPEEYRRRVRDNIKATPEEYFVRAPVVRLEEEEREAAHDVFQTTQAIREAKKANRYPRNPDACVHYGQTCTFWPVCVGEASLEDASRYRKAARAHEELSRDESADEKVRLPLITNSEVSAFRSCNRLWRYRYSLGYRAVHETEARRFGTLIHLGLHWYWEARKAGLSEEEQVTRALEGMRSQKEPEPLQPLGLMATPKWEVIL